MNPLFASSFDVFLPDSAPAAARWVLKLLTHLKHGSLEVVTPEGQCLSFGNGMGHQARIEILSWHMCSKVLKSGDIGFAESYMAKEWTSPDLSLLLGLFLLNRNEVEAAIYGSFWGNLVYRIKHWFRRNTREQARKNIHAHYDLGNDFYKLWLDAGMTYSSALFNGESDRSLEEAQNAKYQALIEGLDIKKGHQILEIGCGWGGFAEKAIKAGAVLTGLTLSKEQLDYAKTRLTRQDLHHQAKLYLHDYRDCEGQFDAIVSIEMFEAVGEAYWPDYFKTIADHLKKGGRAAIQTIVIAQELFERYRKSTDFIQQYIFPGGMLPSIDIFLQHAEKAGLCVQSLYAFGQDYAKTLRLWRERFMSQLDVVKSQGFDDKFIRTWEFYLAYCEAGFSYKNTDVVQFHLIKP